MQDDKRSIVNGGSFDTVTSVRPITPGSYVFEVPDGWGQGRAVYGGIAGALALNAARAAAPDAGEIRGFSLNFVGPLGVGAGTVSTRVLRQGRSAVHLACDVTQEGTVAAGLVVFGDQRSTALDILGPDAPSVIGPDEGYPMPFIDGLTPHFTAQFEYRWVNANLPFSGGDAHILGWVRAKNGISPGPGAVLGLLDAWPPPVWSLLDSPFPGSSVCWNVSFSPAAYRSDLPRNAWWLYESKLIETRQGYATFDATMWNVHGELVAHSRQIFAEFSKVTGL